MNMGEAIKAFRNMSISSQNQVQYEKDESKHEDDSQAIKQRSEEIVREAPTDTLLEAARVFEEAERERVERERIAQIYNTLLEAESESEDADKEIEQADQEI